MECASVRAAWPRVGHGFACPHNFDDSSGQRGKRGFPLLSQGNSSDLKVSAHPHAAGKATQSRRLLCRPVVSVLSPSVEPSHGGIFEPPPCLAPRLGFSAVATPSAVPVSSRPAAPLAGAGAACSQQPTALTLGLRQTVFTKLDFCCEASSSYSKTRSVRTICRREPASRVSGWPNIGSVSAVTTRICVNLQVRVVRMAPGLAHFHFDMCANDPFLGRPKSISPSKSAVDTVSTASMTNWSIAYSTHHWQVT
jgi:hypothetical protein